MAGEATTGNGASGGDIRASILSELASGPKDDSPVEAAPAEKPPEEESETEAGDVEPAEEVEAAADDAEPTDDESADEDADEADESDPKVKSGLDRVRMAEKRSRERLEADRQTLEVERKKHEQDLHELAEFSQLKKRAKYDTAAVLRALGLNDDDFELAAHSIYAESKAGQADPQRKAAAQARLREREKEDKLSATEKRIADLEAKLETERRQRDAQAEASKYIAEINAAAATKYPLVDRMLKVDPDETADALVATYNRLTQTLGRAPKPTEVVAAYDKRERARLAKIGIDPNTIAKTPAPAAKKPANTNGTKPAKPAANSNGEKKKATKEEILAELATLTS